MEGFGEEVRKRILVGTCILTRGYYENYFVPATKVRQLISDEFKNLFRTADFMICPITPALAYKRGLSETDPVRMYLGDVFTTIANLAGLPSISPEPRLHHRRAAYERAAASAALRRRGAACLRLRDRKSRGLARSG